MLTRTTTALLNGLRDPTNEAVWREFDSRYRGILTGFAQRLGLDATDAADAAQEALLQFAQRYREGKYHREKGRLSSWLIGFARNCVAEQLRARAARKEQPGVSAVIELPDRDRLAEIWDAEHQRAIVRQALRWLHEESRTEARTVQAFDLLALEHLSAQEVATRLEMSLNDVYLAKHRCLNRLRRAVAQITAAYEADQ